MLPSPQKVRQENSDPLNQLAGQWLKKARVSNQDEAVNLLALAEWGLQKHLPVPGLDRAAQRQSLPLALGQMLAWQPENWMKWLLSNPEAGDDPEEQRQSLLSLLQQEDSPEGAAVRVLEAIGDRLKAENSHYRQAASEA